MSTDPTADIDDERTTWSPWAIAAAIVLLLVFGIIAAGTMRGCFFVDPQQAAKDAEEKKKKEEEEKKNKKQDFDTFSEAVSHFYSQFKEIKESTAERKFKELQRIAETQKQTIESLRKEEHELRQKGEMIYQHYQNIKEILEELNKASKKYSWKEIKEKLKGHKIIKELNEKERKVVVEI